MQVKQTIMNNPFFTYRARADRIVDGDTLDVEVDLGFKTYKYLRIRLIRVDTHEIYGEDKESEEHERGIEERDFVAEWLNDAQSEWDGDWPILASTQKDSTGKYGRYLANIHRRDTGRSLTDAILEEFDDVAN
jgi:micrococcal nuclease